MINVNGERKRPLGEVLNFPITIQDITVPINVVVTEAESYAAIVGNDWLSKVRANINYESSTMNLTWNKRTIGVPVEYRLMPQEKRKLQGLIDSSSPPKEDDDGSEKEDTDEEETDDDSIKEEEEEFEDDEPEERVFFTMQFEKPRRPTRIQYRNNKKKAEVRKRDPLPESSVILDCKFANVVIDAIYPCEDFVLTNEGIYLGKCFHTWGHLQHLNQKFKTTPPKKATWVYDWKGPKAKCWCRNSLYSPEDACYFCQDDLITYQSVCRLSSTILKELSRGRCDDGVLVLEKVAAENDRQLCYHCGQKTHLEYERLSKEVEYYHVEVGSGIETTPTTIKMKVGTLPTDLELPLLRFLVQRRGNFAWSSSELVIFDRLEDAGLKLNPDKCSFVKEELEFLGHIVSNKGIRTDPAKIQKVKDFPVPLNVTQLRGFLGLASYYRRFVPGFSRIATPLNKLLKKGVAYSWGEEQQVAFEQLKQTLIALPILIFPDFEKQFVLLTDASTFGLGAILSQLDEDGNDRVIAYASRTCNKAESNYSATELECLAVIWAVKHFHAYIYGQRFKLVTDHAALCHLFNTATPIGRLARWVMKLQMYDFETTHRSRRKHLNVDSLSRIRI
ncbi:6824_t:CDS:2 [Rhizophagus irregularis]|nr:6824_t:CDS:2 [Rhizophagus irregularis]